MRVVFPGSRILRRSPGISWIPIGGVGMRRGRREDAEHSMRLLHEAVDMARPLGMHGLLARIKDGAVAI